MQVRKLLNEDDAVSPVIGVILMVAITVILAAVIASFVLGLGNTQSTTPTASFSFDYEADTGSASAGNLSVTHDGGDNIRVTELYLRGNGFNSSVDGSLSFSCDAASTEQADQGKGDDDAFMCDSGGWDGGTSATIGDTSAITAGDRVTAHVNSDYEVRVVWQAQEGDNSATLGSDTGPDA